LGQPNHAGARSFSFALSHWQTGPRPVPLSLQAHSSVVSPTLRREAVGLYPSNPPSLGFNSQSIWLAPHVCHPLNSRPLCRTTSSKHLDSCHLKP
jgi:hypothetical protein